VKNGLIVGCNIHFALNTDVIAQYVNGESVRLNIYKPSWNVCCPLPGLAKTFDPYGLSVLSHRFNERAGRTKGWYMESVVKYKYETVWQTQYTLSFVNPWWNRTKPGSTFGYSLVCEWGAWIVQKGGKVRKTWLRTIRKRFVYNTESNIMYKQKRLGLFADLSYKPDWKDMWRVLDLIPLETLRKYLDRVH